MRKAVPARKTALSRAALSASPLVVLALARSRPDADRLAGDGIAAAEPAAKIDIGASPRAERAELR
jgi:hypothetical protein